MPRKLLSTSPFRLCTLPPERSVLTLPGDRDGFGVVAAIAPPRHSRMTGEDSVRGTSCVLSAVVMKTSFGRISRIPASRLSAMRSAVARCRPTSGSLFALAAAILLLVGNGCGTIKVYKPSELPIPYQAPTFQDPTALNLGALTLPQNKSDLIAPGYLLEISLAAGLDHDSSTTVHVRVNEDGSASLPEIGPVRLAGLDEVQAEGQIAAVLVQGGLYRRPTVGVRIERRPSNKITVVGAVKNPGIQEVPRSASYLGAVIVLAGGFTDKADTKIHIARFSREPRLVDVDLADESQRPRAGEYLDDGAVVTVDKRDLPPVHVSGLVNTSKAVDCPVNRRLRLLDAIAVAGGISNDWAEPVTIQRRWQVPEGQVVLIHVSLADAAKYDRDNIPLAPGDVVHVDRTFVTFLYDRIKVFNPSVGVNPAVP